MPHRPDHSRPARPIGDRVLIPLDHTMWEDRIKLRDLVYAVGSMHLPLNRAN
jgi:hypothetical protein